MEKQFYPHVMPGLFDAILKLLRDAGSDNWIETVEGVQSIAEAGKVYAEGLTKEAEAQRTSRSTSTYVLCEEALS